MIYNGTSQYTFDLIGPNTKNLLIDIENPFKDMSYDVIIDDMTHVVNSVSGLTLNLGISFINKGSGKNSNSQAYNAVFIQDPLNNTNAFRANITMTMKWHLFGYWM